MKTLHIGMAQPRYRQRGLTLIELLVSLVIGLVLALAAAAAYLGTRSAATASANMAMLNETGKLALDMIGRDLQMAGFYPMIMSTTSAASGNLGGFTNTKYSTAVAYNQGLFGCDGAVFNPTTRACGSTVATAPDSVVINYFTMPELDASTFGSGFDCLRQSVDLDPNNAAQIADGRPRYVSNRFGLVATSYTAQGVGGTTRTVNTKSLGCNGNGKNPEDTIYQPIFEGIEDMVIRYGVAGTAGTSPETYHTAAEVTALPDVAGFTSWQRVTAIRVCLLTRTPENSRTQDKAGSLRSYANCRGANITYAATDRTIYKKYERVFAIRNNLTGIY